MTEKSPTNIVLVEDAIIDNHAVFVVKSIGANVKRKAGNAERTTWATLESPQDKELRVALPLHAGWELILIYIYIYVYTYIGTNKNLKTKNIM